MGWLRRLFGKAEKTETQSSMTSSPTVDKTQETVQPLPGIQEPQQAPLQTRPLPPPKPFKSKAHHIRYGSLSDVGGRANNEDSSLVLMTDASVTGSPPSVAFFMVADGMGGHENGEYASALTVKTLAQHVIDGVILPQLEERDPGADQKTVSEVLTHALEAANESVQLNFPGGGTTATCAVIRGDLAYIAHVGDSRAYLISDGNMELITRDHLLVRRLQELGQLTAEEAEIHPQRNVLYRAIGQSEELEVDAATRRMPPSSRLLLCSDGLWGVIGDEGIMEILSQHPDPQKACERLIESVNQRNGADNITAVLVQMPD